MKGYCGQLKNEELLRKCASGGIATALMTKCLEEGGVCYGVAYTLDFYGVEYIRITDKKDISYLQGSKYVKAELSKEIIKSLTDDLRNGLNVVFTGLPCELSEITSRLEKANIDMKNLLRVDLKCNGPAPCEALFQYVKNLENEKKCKVTGITTPYKNPSWLPVYIKIDFENGEESVTEFSKTELGVAFDVCKDEKCYYCAYKGNNHKSDMTVSNFWGVNINNPAFNILGSSYAYVYTEKGENSLKELDTFNLFSDDAKKRVSGLPVHTTTPEKIKEYEKFKKNFKKYGLKKAVKKYFSFTEKLRRVFSQ